jgi:multisubunit Na+/H+ antiporter MnhG subunit
MKVLIGSIVIIAAVAACFFDRRWSRRFVRAVFFACLVLAILPPAQAKHMRRAQLHHAYCDAALDYALAAARWGTWVDNRRCW